MITPKKQISAATMAIADEKEIAGFSKEQNAHKLGVIDYAVCAIQWIALKTLEVSVKAISVVIRPFRKRNWDRTE